MVIARLPSGKVKGQAVERVTDRRIALRLRDGTYIDCGTHMLAPPTGMPWPYEKDDVHRALPGSWDRKEVRAMRAGRSIPEFKPWLKPREKPVAEQSGEDRTKLDKRERARQRRLARKARGGK